MGIDKTSADILSLTTQILRSGSELDLKRLRQYLAKFKIEKPDSPKVDENHFRDIPLLIKALKNSKSSNEAMEVLNTENPTKGVLVQLSKEIDLPVAKSDRLEHLKFKIVHELVETRLNSEAIRNPNSKQSLK